MAHSGVHEEDLLQPGAVGMAVVFEAVMPSWQGYLVWGSTILGLGFILSGTPTEFVMLALCVVFSLTGVIGATDAVDGFGNRGTVSLAALFAVSYVIQGTVLLERLLRDFLGQPSRTLMAYVKLAIPSVLFSAFFNNTVTVAVMIPVLMSWCSRLGVHPSRVMMPLSFFSQLGGCLTIMGSSSNLAAYAIFSSSAPPMALMFITGGVTAMFGFVVITALAPLLLRASNVPDDEISATRQNFSIPSLEDIETQSRTMRYAISVDGTIKLGQFDDELDEEESALMKRTEKTHLEYHLLFVLDSTCSLIGHSIESVGLHRMKGVRLLGISSEDGEVIYPPEPFTAEVAQHAMQTLFLEVGDVVKLAVLSTSLTQLRRIRGFNLSMSDTIQKFGTKRRTRQLVEVATTEQSLLLRHPLCQQQLADNFGIVVLGVRRASGPPVCRREYEDFTLLAGDVMLCEAPSYLPEQPPSEFSLVSSVRNSRPPRVGRAADEVRGWLALLSLVLLLVIFWVRPNLQQHLAGLYLLLLFAYVVMKTVKFEELYSAINGPILITVGAAFGVASAFRQSGAADAVGHLLLVFGDWLPLGDWGLYFAVFVTVSVLSSFITANATVILCSSMVAEVADQWGCPVSSLFLVLMFAGNCAFCTPFGYQTNMMVLPHGCYTFSDFVRFGMPVQFFMMFGVVSAVMLGELLQSLGYISGDL
eukprot:GHVR01028265.1.p1 GENE.GHVR01028265.1~~GHVR01028265.1.p1  ORF type:complete len:700 (+),score=121.73 GHVR01028265.1:1370-3469(+)